MAKRKFGASIIILCIAAVTLISGTYAWFLVGGFAELFDIGFDVIEAGGGLLLRGDAGSYGGGKKDNEGWGTKLERADFVPLSFIDPEAHNAASDEGVYKPVSSADGRKFIMVSMENDKFICEGLAPSRRQGGATPENVCFNDFTFSIKSTGAEIPDGGAFIKIKLTGETFGTDGKPVLKDENDKLGAAVAARVALIFDGKTTIYAYDDQGYHAVTEQFVSESITDTSAELNKTKYIIDANDTGNVANAGLKEVAGKPLMKKNTDTGTGTDTYEEIEIPLGSIPGFDDEGTGGVAGAGKEINIVIWLEGNDPECFSYGAGAVAGKNLMAHIKFVTK